MSEKKSTKHTKHIESKTKPHVVDVHPKSKTELEIKGPLLSSKKIILIVVLALVIGLYYIGTYTVAPEPKITAPSENFEVYAILTEAGALDVAVDYTTERLLVAYSLPTDIDADAFKAFTMAAGAKAAPDADKIVVITYRDEQLIDESVVSTSDVQSALNGEITGAELEQRIEVST